jgi:uncharacterized membrane protein
MKKISKTIAMILVLVMVASIFTGCISWWLMTGEPLELGSLNGEGALLALIFLPIIDVVLLPIGLTVFIVRKGTEAARDSRGKKMEGIDTFSAAITSLPEAEYNSLINTFNSLPESELDTLARRFYSLPESEIDSYSQTLKSFSQKEIYDMTQAINSLPEAKIISLMETLNSIPEEKLISTMNRLQNVKSHYQSERSK